LHFGGLVRSAGGWAAVRALDKEGISFKSDERILGDSNFAGDVPAEAGETTEKKTLWQLRGLICKA